MLSNSTAGVASCPGPQYVMQTNPRIRLDMRPSLCNCKAAGIKVVVTYCIASSSESTMHRMLSGMRAV